MGGFTNIIFRWEYYSLIDEFMAAANLRWPNVLIQFEDFQTKHALKLLRRYRDDFLMFNDDIQVVMFVFFYRGYNVCWTNV